MQPIDTDVATFRVVLGTRVRSTKTDEPQVTTSTPVSGDDSCEIREPCTRLCPDTPTKRGSIEGDICPATLGQFCHQIASKCTKLHIEFQKFSGGDTPGPPSAGVSAPRPSSRIGKVKGGTPNY